jgi:GntR family transcriptional regulator
MTDPPVLRIDLDSPVPAYRQIAAGMRALLVSGSFRPGDLLPTIRQLAVDLGVHRNTVAEAYRLLAEEGWLELRRRRGVTVVDRPRRRALPEAASSFARRLHELTAEAIAEGVPVNTVARELRSAAQAFDAADETGGRR